MADRTSAELFGTIFSFLAENPTPAHKSLAWRLYDLSQRYDFSECQMDADDALVMLGIARRGIDPKHPEEGEVMLYGHSENASK